MAQNLCWRQSQVRNIDTRAEGALPCPMHGAGHDGPCRACVYAWIPRVVSLNEYLVQSYVACNCEWYPMMSPKWNCQSGRTNLSEISSWHLVTLPGLKISPGDTKPAPLKQNCLNNAVIIQPWPASGISFQCSHVGLLCKQKHASTQIWKPKADQTRLKQVVVWLTTTYHIISMQQQDWQL